MRSNSTASRPASGAAGFTLVEILCVVVILGIASAIIIPQMGSRDDLKVAAGARTLIADMIYAQNQAISKQKKHFVRFDTAAQTSSLYDSAAMTTPVEHPVRHDGYVTRFDVKGLQLAGIRIDSADIGGQVVLGFDELGAPFGFDGVNEVPLAAAGQIVIRCGTETLTVAIQPFTGEATLQ